MRKSEIDAFVKLAESQVRALVTGASSRMSEAECREACSRLAELAAYGKAPMRAIAQIKGFADGLIEAEYRKGQL
jgi:hypothetical protein